ncbi:glycoside hydrolase family protein [Dyadobacter subterraneus]|uniref:Glycoside hydrolase family protein n=1 Tax=Dyadobacter subterraneus TaxID=2773304 RepID=A0ABR9WM81_9BACT|nr:glycoside hydrolase family protein [Dyadobacter subterraneus]MBE9466628.1 glycoside hydrolase family protein [Dyadobacter subterraneus]
MIKKKILKKAMRSLFIMSASFAIYFFSQLLKNDHLGASLNIGGGIVEGGFKMKDYWVWDGSAIQTEDGKFHLFASRWPKKFPFRNGYLHYSEIVRASADKPEGPYTFQEVVLPNRVEGYFDGRMTHNPTICKIGDQFVLFYIGSTYKGVCPTVEQLMYKYESDVYQNIRIGMATAKAIGGPWHRLNTPILAPKSGSWDSTIVTNPSPCILANGNIVLAYRSNTPKGLRVGIAIAKSLKDSFRRISNGPIGDFNIEDPYLWLNKDNFEIIAKDMTGELTGEKHAGVRLISKDCRNWMLAITPKAYSRTISWSNLETKTLGSLERPQLLLLKNRPKYIFAASADNQGWEHDAENTWITVRYVNNYAL